MMKALEHFSQRGSTPLLQCRRSTTAPGNSQQNDQQRTPQVHCSLRGMS
jgi:hypothetical protein